MAAYLAGRHHPQLAFPQRVAFLAEVNEAPAGYIAGHLTRRFGCQGEVQYLYVARPFRRAGAASALLKILAEWFVLQEARRICVNVNVDSPGADSFYVSHGAESLQPYWRVWPDIAKLVS
jgi:GNAT superfamily N-acetyltransferase